MDPFATSQAEAKTTVPLAPQNERFFVLTTCSLILHLLTYIEKWENMKVKIFAYLLFTYLSLKSVIFVGLTISIWESLLNHALTIYNIC